MAPPLDFKQVNEYIDSLVPERAPELEAMEAKAREKRFPAIGPGCGQFCHLTARLIEARRIFELGSGFGYSTAWFARAVSENGGGQVHHVVWDEDLSGEAKTHLDRLGLSEQVVFHVGEAVETLSRTEGPFDLVFNDIDKHAYPASLPVIKEKLRPGGVLIIDNMLWGGRIFDPEDGKESTAGVKEFTRLITEDRDWTVSLVPMRDGMIVARLGS